MVEPRRGHPYHMYEAILEQPQAVLKVLEDEKNFIKALGEELRNLKPRALHIVGIGTSWHAALIGEFLLRSEVEQMPVGAPSRTLVVRAWNAFEFNLQPPVLDSQSVVLALSHRSTKTYSARALELSKASGAGTVLFTGIDSPSSRGASATPAAYHIIHTSRAERSSAFTISHLCAITALHILARSLSQRDSDSFPEVLELSSKLRAFLQREETPNNPTSVSPSSIRDWILAPTAASSCSLLSQKHHYFVGYGGFDVSNAMEACLKIKEACYLLTEGFQLEQYLHGPFVATDENTSVTFLAATPSGQAIHSRVKDMIQAVLTVDGRVNIILSEESVAEITPLLTRFDPSRIHIIPIPSSSSPFVMGSLTLVALQLITYYLSLARGTNPDVFRRDDPRHKAATALYTL